MGLPVRTGRPARSRAIRTGLRHSEYHITDLHRYRACAAYILDRRWEARAWNRQAEHLFTGWLDTDDKNLLRFIFLDPCAKALIHLWHERAQRVVAEFRAHAGSHLNEPALQSIVADLVAQSPIFAQFWHQHDVLERAGGERTFNHPTDGFLRYHQLAFNLIGQPDLKLTILVRPDEQGAVEPACHSASLTGI